MPLRVVGLATCIVRAGDGATASGRRALTLGALPSDAYTVMPVTRKSLRLRSRAGVFSIVYFPFAI